MEPEDPCRQRGHLPHSLLHPEDAPLPRVEAEDPRERAVVPRVGRRRVLRSDPIGGVDAAVGADRHPGAPHDHFHVLPLLVEVDEAEATPHLTCNGLQDLSLEELEYRVLPLLPPLLGDICYSLPHERRVDGAP